MNEADKLRMKQLEEKCAQLEREVHDIQKLDAQRMRAAVIALGAAVIGLASYIWAGVVGAFPK